MGEPISTHGWYKINLAKDNGLPANMTRSSYGPYLESDESFIPWTKLCISGNTTETKRVEWLLDGQKCLSFEGAFYNNDRGKYFTSNPPKECKNEKGKPMECCLQHKCDEAYGWVGIEKKDVSDIAVGCILPHDAFGDPRYYKYMSEGFDSGEKRIAAKGCYSHTTGWWVWEEDYSWHFGKPLRVKEQEIGDDLTQRKMIEVEGMLVERATEMNKCVKDRWHRDVCPYVLPCDPLEACLGDNKCALGYAGKKMQQMRRRILQKRRILRYLP